jgi:ABC-2 type transport system ATP-binding protein
MNNFGRRIVMEISIRKMSKHFGRVEALANVSLEIKSGELLGLIGPSGSGKTTLIRLITGAITGENGEIFVGGQRMPDRAVLREIGYMPQSDALYNDLSGLDNLRFFGHLCGLRGKTLESRAQSLLEQFNLAGHQKRMVADYSGGMRKRLSLAIALVHEPPILLLDEPTVGIDPLLRRAVWDLFQNYSREGRTLVVSTHVMDEAERCQTAALLYNGRLIARDTIEGLKAIAPQGSLENLFLQTGTEVAS